MALQERKKFFNLYKELVLDQDDKSIILDPKLKCRVKFRSYTKEEGNCEYLLL